MSRKPRLADAIAQAQHDAARLDATYARARLERERDQARAEAKLLRAHNEELNARIALLEKLDNVNDRGAPWLTRMPGKGKLHHGIISLILSDTHFDEVVNPDEVGGVNAYNREIGRQRLHRMFDNVVTLARRYYQGIHYDGVALAVLGDLLSGNIHEELTETNADTVYGSLDYWSDEVAAFILGLAEEFGKVDCVGIVGNHGRRTRKPVAKRRAKDNLDWLLYRSVAKLTKHDARITWQIPESTDAHVPVYSTRYEYTHGDQFRGGGGISGLMAPLMLGHHRKARRQMAIGRGFDWLCMGHWHEYLHGRGLIVNSSLKGYDEYAYVNNYVPERAMQAMWITTPEHGASFASPVIVDDRKAEGW